MPYRYDKDKYPSAWSIIRNEMNVHPLRYWIRRKTLANFLCRANPYYRVYGAYHTVSSYLNLLRGAGFIRPTPQRGVYVVKKRPGDLTATQLKELYKNRNKRNEPSDYRQGRLF